MARALIDSGGHDAGRLSARIRDLEVENAQLCARLTASSDAAAVRDPRSVATRLRELLTALLESYEAAGGISRDAYCATPQWHAMAEALYLEGVVVAHSAGLMTTSQAAERARASIARLEAGALHRDPGAFAQWGLGFCWRDFPQDEPFLVTTALVTRAITSAHALVPSRALAREGLAGVARLPARRLSFMETDFSVPVAYPSVDDIVDNAIALWAQLVIDHQDVLNPDENTVRDAGRALAWLDQRFVQGLGWAYSDKQPVFDLIHQIYILEALRIYPGATNIEQRAVETLAAFRAGAGFVDSMTLTDRTSALEIVARSGSHYLLFRADHTLTVKAEPARLGSRHESGLIVRLA